MSRDQVNPLNPLLGKIERFENADASVRQFESTRVEWTLRRLNMESQLRKIKQQSHDGLITFDDLNQTVDFPIHLKSESLKGEIPIHRDQRSTHPMWFKGFLKLPIVQKFEELFEAYHAKHTGDKPIGMVFPRKGFAQGLIIHNGDWNLYVPPNSSCHLYQGGNKTTSLIVQPYMGLVDHVKTSLL
jgi:hypothetical protein